MGGTVGSVVREAEGGAVGCVMSGAVCKALCETGAVGSTVDGAVG